MTNALEMKMRPDPSSGSLQMLNINDVRLSGRLAEDPAIRSAILGKVSVYMNVAVNRSYRDDDGKWHKEVAFVPVVVWENMAHYCGNRLRRGSPVYVEGRLRNDRWKGAGGDVHSALRVHASRVQALQKKGALSETPVAQAEFTIIQPDAA